MARIILKLNDGERDWWLEWSTIVDAPVTHGMSRAQYLRYYRREHGQQGQVVLAELLERIERTGTSAQGQTVADVIQANRAGPKESTLTLAEIIEEYCRKRPARERPV